MKEQPPWKTRTEDPSQEPLPGDVGVAPAAAAPPCELLSNQPCTMDTDAGGVEMGPGVVSGMGTISKTGRVFPTMPSVQEMSPEGQDHMELYMEDVIGEKPTTPRVSGQLPAEGL